MLWFTVFDNSNEFPKKKKIEISLFYLIHETWTSIEIVFMEHPYEGDFDFWVKTVFSQRFVKEQVSIWAALQKKKTFFNFLFKY